MRIALLFPALAALAAAPAFAACDDPAWDTAMVAARIASAVPALADAPHKRNAGTGFGIALAPVADVTFDAPPERPPRNPDSRGAVLHFDAGEPGTYQVAVSAKAWIDIVQDGAVVPSVSFADFPDCAEFHKIVAFEIGAGPFTLQLSDATAPSVTLALTRAP